MFYKNSLINIFTFLTLISNVPSIMVITIVPFLFDSNLNIQVGLIFLMYRIGNLLGLLISKRINNFKPNITSFKLELFNVITAVGLLFTIKYHSKPLYLIISLFLIKGFVSSTQTSIRARWLKSISSQGVSSGNTLIICSSLIQSSFGIAGIVYLFIRESEIFVSFILSLDIFTSIIASFLYFLTKSNSIKEKNFNDFFKFQKLNFRYVYIFLVDIFTAIAFSGTNVLLIEMGNTYISNLGGYPIVLIVYSFNFLVSPLLIAKFNIFSPKRLYLVLFFIFLGFLLFSFYSFTKISFLALAVLLFFYSQYLNIIEKFWFEKTSHEYFGLIYNTRIFILTIIWSLGELIYTYSESSFLLRTGSIAIALFFLLYQKIKTKPSPT